MNTTVEFQVISILKAPTWLLFKCWIKAYPPVWKKLCRSLTSCKLKIVAFVMCSLYSFIIVHHMTLNCVISAVPFSHII